MIQLFKNNNPLALLILACIAAIPHFHAPSSQLVLNIPIEHEPLGDLFQKATNHFFETKSIWNSILSIIIILTEALALNKIITDIKLIDRPGFIPALCFVLFSSLIPAQYQSYNLLTNGLILIVLNNIAAFYKKDKPNSAILLASFTAGIIAGFSPGNLPLFLWLSGALFIMRPASLREWMLMITGFVLPYYFLIAGLYLANSLDLGTIFHFQKADLKFPHLPTPFWIRSAFFFVLPLFGFIYYFNNLTKMLIQARRVHTIIFLLFLASSLMAFLRIEHAPFSFFIITIPASILASPLFGSSKRAFLPNLLLLIVLFLCLIG